VSSSGLLAVSSRLETYSEGIRTGLVLTPTKERDGERCPTYSIVSVYSVFGGISFRSGTRSRRAPEAGLDRVGAELASTTN